MKNLKALTATALLTATAFIGAAPAANASPFTKAEQAKICQASVKDAITAAAAASRYQAVDFGTATATNRVREAITYNFPVIASCTAPAYFSGGYGQLRWNVEYNEAKDTGYSLTAPMKFQ